MSIPVKYVSSIHKVHVATYYDGDFHEDQEEMLLGWDYEGGGHDTW